MKPDGVQISVVKRAEDGRGPVFRLAEMKGGKKPSRAEIQLFQPVKDAVKTNIIEEDGVGLSPQNGTMIVPIAPLGIETVRVSF